MCGTWKPCLSPFDWRVVDAEGKDLLAYLKALSCGPLPVPVCCIAEPQSRIERSAAFLKDSLRGNDLDVRGNDVSGQKERHADDSRPSCRNRGIHVVLLLHLVRGDDDFRMTFDTRWVNTFVDSVGDGGGGTGSGGGLSAGDGLPTALDATGKSFLDVISGLNPSEVSESGRCRSISVSVGRGVSWVCTYGQRHVHSGIRCFATGLRQRDDVEGSTKFFTNQDQQRIPRKA